MTDAPLIVIGASAGGPAAVAEVIRQLPADLGAAVLVVQHIDAQFAPGLASWLNECTALPVRLAADGERPRAGEVLLAHGAHHIVLTAAGRLRPEAEPRHVPYRPSIDLLFSSVARHARGFVAGVVLTGMGRDGAEGLKALRAAGALTIVQDRATSAIYGMPKAAVALDASHTVLPLGAIAARLVHAVRHPGSMRSTHRG